MVLWSHSKVHGSESICSDLSADWCFLNQPIITIYLGVSWSALAKMAFRVGSTKWLSEIGHAALFEQCRMSKSRVSARYRGDRSGPEQLIKTLSACLGHRNTLTIAAKMPQALSVVWHFKRLGKQGTLINGDRYCFSNHRHRSPPGFFLAELKIKFCALWTWIVKMSTRTLNGSNL